jgi:D-tyrosyl-tRNA(Tyr) deacylase
MRAVIQRVSRARVHVDDTSTAEIGHGLVILLGIGHEDGDEQAEYLARKIANLRIFEDEAGKMNRSVLEVGGEAIVVSQFTLYADTAKGRRPSFINAGDPQVAEPLVDQFVRFMSAEGVATQTGVFGAHMEIELVNDGPVTIWMEK